MADTLPSSLPESVVAEIDAAMANEAITSLTRYAPANAAGYHDGAEDEKLLENVRNQTPWIRRIIAKSVAELQ